MELSNNSITGCNQKGFSILKVIGTTLLLSGTTLAGYYGWEYGHVPGNKRAISTEAMREAIEKKIALDARSSSSPCIYSHSWNGIKEARKGLPGIAWVQLPGLLSVTHFIDDIGPKTASAQRYLKAKEFFSKQGFYDREQVEVQTDTGLIKAVQYTLNLDGYLAARSYKLAKECFPIGERALHKISAIKKLDEKVVGQEAWKVNYQTELVNQPEWASSSEAREIFHEIKDYDRILEHTAILIRGEEKWVLEDIAFLQLSRSQVDARDNRKLKKINQRLFLIDAPPLQVDESSELLNAFVESDRWRSHLACLPFRLTSGGDDQSLATSLRRDRSKPLSAHFFDVDASQRKRITSSSLASELYIWNALSAGGFVDIAPLEKGTYKYYGKLLENPEGVKVTLNKDIGTFLNVGTYRRCFPFGTFDVEFLGHKPQKNGVYEVLALGKPKGTPDWVKPIAAKWPALKHAIEHGVIISGAIHYERVVSDDAQATNKGEWRIQNLKVHYPRTKHHEIPPVFQPLLPTSQSSWPLLKGPINVQALQDRNKNTPLLVSRRDKQIKPKKQTHRQPNAKSTVRNNHSVTIYSSFEPNYVKNQLIAEYGNAGAATPWLLSKTYSSGRYYFEAQGNAVGQLSYAGHANISFSDNPKRDHLGFGGVQLIKHGEKRVRSNKDIFGIAIDYNKGSLYHHINGEWINGAPGDNAGLKIKKNTQYSPIFVATGNRQGRKGVYWEINLGRTGFTYEIPEGFKPYGS